MAGVMRADLAPLFAPLEWAMEGEFTRYDGKYITFKEQFQLLFAKHQVMLIGPLDKNYHILVQGSNIKDAMDIFTSEFSDLCDWSPYPNLVQSI